MLVLLFVVWVIFNGRIAPDVIITGIILSAAINAFAMKYCKWYVTKDWRGRGFVPRIFAYFGILIWEIIKSNWQMIKLILDPKMKEKIHPQVVKFDVEYDSTIMRSLLANSITLTPGTITIRERKTFFIVHALTPEMGEGMTESVFYKWCNKMDKFTSKPVTDGGKSEKDV